jgi:predicted ATPase
MGTSLNKITITGFKSLKSLKDFQLGALNIMVGGNGAGKSNFVDFFRMLRAMADAGLQRFITSRGSADGFFFNGPKATPKIHAHLCFGYNEYQFTLSPTAGGDLMVADEQTLYTQGGGWRYHGGGKKESGLKGWIGSPSPWGPYPTVEHHVSEAVSSWMVYHFHDTSANAPVRRECLMQNWRELEPDAGNVAAFLARLRDENAERYGRIRETIRMVAPFFDDFLLEPQKKGEEELVKLEWRQKGTTFPFQPYHFSDGTIRFICLATTLLQPKPPSTIVIDEPELGLHPYALDLLAELFRETSQRTQLIVSTQSATLLNQFKPEQVVVVDREEGASRFRRLESEPLKAWLEDFTLGELWQKNVFEGGPRHE